MNPKTPPNNNPPLEGSFKRGSIFFRILVWFWLTMSIITLTLLTITVTAQSGPVFELWKREIGDALNLYGQAALLIYKRDGAVALMKHVNELERSAHDRVYFFDSEFHEISGRAVTAAAGELAKRSAKSGKVEFEFKRRMFLSAKTIVAPDGKEYTVLRQVSRGGIQALLNQVHALGLKLIVFLIIGGTLCYWLARYLAAPIFKLQGAARKLAAGDLSVRVSDAIGKRPYEIAALGKDFDLMAARIEALLQAQRRLLRDISHELRSPLARLNVALEIARQRANPESEPFLDRIEQESNRVNELISRLLAVERLEADAGMAGKEWFDLSDLAKEIALDANFEAQDRTGSVRIVQTEPMGILGIRELIRSAFENVVRNALRYDKPGSKIEISLAKEQRDGIAYGVVRIRDHGEGVPEEALPHLFRPFFRVAEARERTAGGSGLGLTITDRAVRLHGGSVSAFNAEDGGLVVEMVLPLGGQ